MKMAAFLVAMRDEGNEILFTDAFCKGFVVVECKLFNLGHTLDVSIVSSFLKFLIAECYFVHTLAVSTHDETNRKVLSASNFRFNTSFCKPLGFPFCDTCIYFFLDANRFIDWCNDCSLTYFKVEMFTTWVVISLWIVKFTFPLGLIPFALMFCA